MPQLPRRYLCQLRIEHLTYALLPKDFRRSFGLLDK